MANKGTVFLIGAVLLSTTAAKAEPKSIVVLGSWHNLEISEQACNGLLGTANINEISRVLSNPSDYDPEDVKFEKQLSDGIWECKSVKDRRELGRCLENNIMDQLAVNQHCAGVSAYLEWDEKFDGKLNEAAKQAEDRNDYWSLLVDNP